MAKMAEFPWPLHVSLKQVCGLRGYIMLYPTYGVAIVITIVITSYDHSFAQDQRPKSDSTELAAIQAKVQACE